MTANNPTHAGCVNSGVPTEQEAAIPDYEKRWSQEEYSIALEDVYELISAERRRLLIFVLAEHGRDYDGTEGPYVPVGDVAETIAEATPNEATDRKAVYIALIQNHLSKLDDAGVITYYERAKKIRPELGVYQLESILLGVERAVSNGNPGSTEVE